MTIVGEPQIDEQPEQHDHRFTWIKRIRVSKPTIDERPEEQYMGIRTQTAFKTKWEVEVAIKLMDD